MLQSSGISVFKCHQCDRWFKHDNNKRQVGCLVLHKPPLCCHYNDVALADDDPLVEDSNYVL